MNHKQQKLISLLMTDRQLIAAFDLEILEANLQTLKM